MYPYIISNHRPTPYTNEQRHLHQRGKPSPSNEPKPPSLRHHPTNEPRHLSTPCISYRRATQSPSMSHNISYQWATSSTTKEHWAKPFSTKTHSISLRRATRSSSNEPCHLPSNAIRHVIFHHWPMATPSPTNEPCHLTPMNHATFHQWAVPPPTNGQWPRHLPPVAI